QGSAAGAAVGFHQEDNGYDYDDVPLQHQAASHEALIQSGSDYHGVPLQHQAASHEALIQPGPDYHEDDILQGSHGDKYNMHLGPNVHNDVQYDNAGDYFIHNGEVYDSASDIASHERDYPAHVRYEDDTDEDGSPENRNGVSSEESPLPESIHSLLEPTPPPLHSYPVTSPRRWIWIAG
ncbi:unnamed protein product, partial [Meganyctiphanes norvegica]